MTGRTRIRTAGWVATAAIAVGLALPAASFAATGHPAPISDTSVSVSCTGGPGGSSITPGAGQVAWLFVHANVSRSTKGTLTAVYTSAGTEHATSYIQGGVKYLVVTNGSDTLTAFSDTISGGQLVLSHVCYGTQGDQPISSPTDNPTNSPTSSATDNPTNSPTDNPSTSPSNDTTTTPSGDPSSNPSTSPSNDTTTTPSGDPSSNPSTSPSNDLTTTPSGDPSSNPSNDTTTTTPSSDPSSAPSTDPSKAPTSTPVSQVLGITGTPQITPPPTDVVSAQGGNGGTSWQLVLLAVAGIAATLFVLTPATARKRR